MAVVEQSPDYLSAIIWLVGAYLIGAIPVGFVIGRLRGVDLRAVGSGNIGASNATRALGKNWGLPVFGLDVIKAALPAWLTLRAADLPVPEDWRSFAVAAVGMAAFLGHIYPIYLGFRGGKGVACALGVCLVVLPSAGLGALILYLQTLWLTRVSAIGSLTGVSMMALFVLLGEHEASARYVVLLMTAIIWWRHRSNIRELRARDTKSTRPAKSP